MSNEFNTDAHVLTIQAMRDALIPMTTRNLPVFIWGSPGIGKSDLIQQVAEARGIEYRDIRLVQYDPVDLRGIPVADMENATTKWLTPDNLPRDGEGILALEELNSAPPLVQAAAYQLVLDRRLGEYTLPDGWSIVACGNLETDRGVTHRMPTPLANRFTHFELRANVDAWTEWAIDADLPVETVTFMRYRPELLHVFDARSNEKRFPTPRSWARVADVLQCELPLEVEYAAIAGTIGDKAAAEFSAYLRTFRRLPNPDAVLMDPANADVPENDPATMYALAGILARRADDENIDRVYTYASRMPDEFTTLVMVDAVRRTPTLQQTRTFVKFATEYQDLIL